MPRKLLLASASHSIQLKTPSDTDNYASEVTMQERKDVLDLASR